LFIFEIGSWFFAQFILSCEPPLLMIRIFICWDGVLGTFLPGLVCNCTVLVISAFQVPRITGLSHCSQLTFHFWKEESAGNNHWQKIKVVSIFCQAFMFVFMKVNYCCLHY
jgi:hypothetical protein